MKKIALLILFILISMYSYNCYSQSKFGNATVEELSMTSYPQDTTAAAVMLLKKGDTRFVYSNLYGFQFEYTLQVKIKILKTEGLKWCDEEIPYYQARTSSKEEIRGLSGTTYNLEDGKVIKTKLSKDFIFEEDTDNKQRLRKFTMPAAKVGSVIEYKYTIVSDFFYDLRDFNFQSSIPILYTSFEATLPEYFRYNLNTQGYVAVNPKKEPVNETFHIQYKDDNGRTQATQIRCSADRYNFEATNVPAIKDQSYLWTINDYITKVSFELKSVQMPYSTVKNYSSTWDNIDKEIMESSQFGGNLKKADLFKDEISKGDVSFDRAKEIQNMVKYKVKWNELNAFYPKNLKDALKNGIGTSAEVNFLLINALQAGGFDAFPVIMSTRSNGRMPISHPSISAFNYIITGIQIDTVMYYTDAAAKYGDWNLLPEKCMVPQARILKDGYGNWVDLTKLSNGSVLKTINLTIENSKLIGRSTDTRKSNASYNGKASYYNHKDQNDYIESINKRLSCEIDSFSISNLDNTTEALQMSYIQSSDVDMSDEYLYITPLSDKPYSENPFKRETRDFPIEFDYLINFVQIINFTVPEGYTVEELPKAERMILNDNDVSLTYRIVQSNNLIRLHYQYQLKKLQFLPTEYEDLRNFFSKLIAKNSEQIVLKKVATTL